MIFEKPNQALRRVDVPIPICGVNEVLLKVHSCGVCRTDLHIFDGELKNPKLPLILGHEIVGTIVDKGEDVERFIVGDKVGVPWLGLTCGHCEFCITGRENLCINAKFTGYTIDGGFAEYTVAHEDYCFLLPENYSDSQAAPLLCAGMIGYRSLVATEDAKKIGVYGFGAAAHIIGQIATLGHKEIYAFTKADDLLAQNFARQLGALWAGDSTMDAPEILDAAIIFAPVGALIPKALKNVKQGGVVVCAGIHMSDIPSFPYSLLWGERVIKSIANLSRKDGDNFFKIIKQKKIKTEINTFRLEEANTALDFLRRGSIRGAAVLVMD